MTRPFIPKIPGIPDEHMVLIDSNICPKCKTPTLKHHKDDHVEIKACTRCRTMYLLGMVKP